MAYGSSLSFIAAYIISLSHFQKGLAKMELQEQIFNQINKNENEMQSLPAFLNNAALDEKIAAHRVWLQGIRRERPSPAAPYRIGVYIRYFNQTRYKNYLDYHKKHNALYYA